MKTRLLFIGLLLMLFSAVNAQFTVSTIGAGCFNICNGSARITPSTGYRYMWSTGDSTSAADNLCAGAYSCTVSDTLGVALDTLIATITQPPALTYNVTVQNTSCPGADNGVITFSAAGGVPPYYYLVTQVDSGYSFSGNNIFTGLDSGSYRIAVVDVNECAVRGDTVYVGLLSSICTGIKDIPQLKNFSIQPNPANDFTRVVYELNETEPFKISILDITGKKVQQVLNEITAKGRHSITINLTTLPAGEYILNVVSGSGSFNISFVKE